MDKFKKLFVLRVALLFCIAVMAVSFFWAYVWEVIFWRKSLFESFVCSAWNWVLFVSSIIVFAGLSVVEGREDKKEEEWY